MEYPKLWEKNKKYKRINWKNYNKDNVTGIPGENVTCCFNMEIKHGEENINQSITEINSESN